MPAAAYARARKLCEPRRGLVLWAKALGVAQALLILLALLLSGALAALVASRGETWHEPFSDGAKPAWLAENIADRVDGMLLFPGTGLYPIASNNQASPNPIHRAAAAVVGGLVRRLPTLRNNLGALTTLLSLILLDFFALSLIVQAKRSAVAEATQEAATALRRQIHRQMYRLGESSLPSEGTGSVLTLFTREVNDIRSGLSAELLDGYRVPVLIAGLVLFALAISVPLTIFLVSLGGLTWLIYRHLNRSVELASVIATRESALQLCLLQEDFGLIRTVRVHGMENIDKQRFDEHLEQHREAENRRILHEARTSPAAILLICAAATLGVGLLAEGVVINGQSAASALMLVVALLGLIAPGVNWMMMKRAVRQADRSAEGVFGYLERKPELHQAGGAMFLPPIREKISFENVTLEGGSGRVLFDGLTVEIPAKSKTSIMSLDDEAKTAMVCLIPRLIDPKVGRVRIDGVDLRDVTLESVRAQVATVLQADLVFSDTVLANIALGDPSYDLPRVIESAKVAHAHNFIQDLPQGYDTVIGPLGAYLKPDQQYRIALARAYLHDPSILIIEEPTDPLDDEIKMFVDDTVSRLAPGRTLIMLPHRLSTIRSSDRVILIHNGKLENAGSPREISGESKLYRHLQYIEFNQFATGEIEAGQIGA